MHGVLIIMKKYTNIGENISESPCITKLKELLNTLIYFETKLMISNFFITINIQIEGYAVQIRQAMEANIV